MLKSLLGSGVNTKWRESRACLVAGGICRIPGLITAASRGWGASALSFMQSFRFPSLNKNLRAQGVCCVVINDPPLCRRLLSPPSRLLCREEVISSVYPLQTAHWQFQWLLQVLTVCRGLSRGFGMLSWTVAAAGRSWRWHAVPRWPVAVPIKLHRCAVCSAGFSLAMDCGSCLGSSLEPGLLSPSSEMHKPRQKWFVRMG